MRIKIYSRKSKFTGKGESIENQIQLCKEYALKNFGVTVSDEDIYEDEGYSGGTTDRPQFQLLMKEVRAKKLDLLICYRLDRLSRSVLDFSSTMEVFQKHGIDFVSIREQFDTSTPMGRAMMYIASVFAQLERETAAERIRDNMLELAKTGRWLGGITPTGYESQPVIYYDAAGKERQMYKLSPVDEELEIIKLIYDRYLEFKSLTKLEQFCIINNYKSRNGVDFGRYSLRSLLTNPVYTVADEELYDYLFNNSFDIYSKKSQFTGEFGLMAYNKTNQGENDPSSRFRDVSEWIVAVGAHTGVIESKKWIRVQELLMQNKSKSFRKVKNTTSLLSGILKCKICGSYMRPKMGRENKAGEMLYYYMCEMKEKSKRTRCDVKNVQGNEFDRIVLDEMKKLSAQDSLLYNTIKNDKISIQSSQNSTESEIKILESKIAANKESITNLVSSLSHGKETSAAKYIINQIEALDKSTAEMNERLLKLKDMIDINQQKEGSLDVITSMLSAFKHNIDEVDVEAKRTFLRSIVEAITWDGINAEIVLFGANAEKKLVPPTE